LKQPGSVLTFRNMGRYSLIGLTVEATWECVNIYRLR